jgi:membrane protease YdiL (CAAX protease family)
VFALIGLCLSLLVTFTAYSYARRVVRDRLRFVDAAQSRKAPWIAGVIVAVIAAPLVAVVPLLGIGTAIGLGLSVGFGVAAGAREAKRAGYEIQSGF